MEDPGPNATYDESAIAERYLATFERLLHAYQAMTAEERAALSAWEAEFVTGDGRYATSDWPGWAAAVERISN